MSMKITRRWLDARARLDEVADRLLQDEQGEGVISAAIAVLIMAFLGAAMWVAFNTLFRDASDTVSDQVSRIGQ
ncbi:MAG: hypothetical protein ACLGIR_00425 [Actinomycetes bacterium]